MMKKFALFAAVGVVSLLSGLAPCPGFVGEGVAFAQPVFAPPVNLGPKINSQWYESDPFWDGPRKRLYFVKAGPMTLNQSEDIWFAEMTDTGWTDPKPVGGGINTEEIEHSPSVSPDGRQRFFIGFFRPGSPTAWDVWMSRWDSIQNDWGAPVNLGCPVSTPAGESSAKIAPDGRTLYFQSDEGSCGGGAGLIGLYWSVFDSISGWSLPQYLGPNINAGNLSNYPSITVDGLWFYSRRFVSDGTSIFVSPWNGTDWGPGIDLRPQIGERAGAPSITPSGDSLFFATPLLNSQGSNDIFVMERIPTDVEDGKGSSLPFDFELHQNYPNPFNSQTRISLKISQSVDGPVKLTVYNLAGQSIRILLQAQKLTGKKGIIWDGTDDNGKEVSSGIYLYRLTVGNRTIVKKAVFIK